MPEDWHRPASMTDRPLLSLLSNSRESLGHYSGKVVEATLAEETLDLCVSYVLSSPLPPCHFQIQHNTGLLPSRNLFPSSLIILVSQFLQLRCPSLHFRVLQLSLCALILPLSLSPSGDQLSPWQHTRRQTQVFSHFPFPSPFSSLPSPTRLVLTLLRGGWVKKRDSNSHLFGVKDFTDWTYTQLSVYVPLMWAQPTSSLFFKLFMVSNQTSATSG